MQKDYRESLDERENGGGSHRSRSPRVSPTGRTRVPSEAGTAKSKRPEMKLRGEAYSTSDYIAMLNGHDILSNDPPLGVQYRFGEKHLQKLELSGSDEYVQFKDHMEGEAKSATTLLNSDITKMPDNVFRDHCAAIGPPSDEWDGAFRDRCVERLAALHGDFHATSDATAVHRVLHAFIPCKNSPAEPESLARAIPKNLSCLKMAW